MEKITLADLQRTLGADWEEDKDYLQFVRQHKGKRFTVYVQGYFPWFTVYVQDAADVLKWDWNYAWAFNQGEVEMVINKLLESLAG